MKQNFVAHCQMRVEERYRRLDADTLELVETITDPRYYSKPFSSDTKIWKLDREGSKAWDEQIYCVPSGEFKSTGEFKSK
jgi:hypothetical protein